jgi:hypothetical protein
MFNVATANGHHVKRRMVPDRHMPGSVERMLVYRARILAIDAGEMEPAICERTGGPSMMHPDDLTMADLAGAAKSDNLICGPEGEAVALPSLFVNLNELKKYLPLDDEVSFTGKKRIGR